MRVIVASVLISLFLGGQCKAQVRAIPAGSAEAAAELAEISRRMAEDRREWSESTKLTHLESLPDAPRRIPELSPDSLKDSQVGYLEYWHTEVLQVVGPTDVILEIGSAKFPPIWLRGYSTKGLADGQIVRLIGLVRTEGTKTYTTIEGAAKTVRVIELIKKDESLKLEAELAAKQAVEAEERQYREWKDSKGEILAIAKLVDFKNGYVKLERKDDRKLLSVKISKLDEEDQKVVRRDMELREAAKERQKENEKKEKSSKQKMPGKR